MFFIFEECVFASDSTPNPSVVGWSNLVFPGAGEAIRGNWDTGAIQAGYEFGTFGGGYALSEETGIQSLDGLQDTFVPFSSGRVRNRQASIEQHMESQILLEFSIKAHMTNTFLAYRDAYKARGITEGLDQHSALDGLAIPFDKRYIEMPDVWIPLALVAGLLVVDYSTTRLLDQSRSPLSTRVLTFYTM